MYVPTRIILSTQQVAMFRVHGSEAGLTDRMSNELRRSSGVGHRPDWDKSKVT